MNELLQAPPITPLPPAPLLERFLLEQPLLPVIVLALLAIIAVVAFFGRSQRRRGLLVAGILIAIAGAVYATASLVTTEREHLQARTVELIGATAQADTAALQDLLTEDASLRVTGELSRVLQPLDGREAILDAATYRLRGRYTIDGWSIRDSQATIDGPNVGRTLVRVGVDASSFSRTHYSWWRLHWERGPGGVWRCFEIEPRWIQFGGSAD
ncbi:MAG: hypothetical protein ACIAS6_05350 [Phycisphaerales bacterium JB060]